MRFIFKIEIFNKKLYGEWSTIVDAPYTPLMELDKFKKYYRFQYGASSMEELEKRLERVEKTGCSAHEGSIEDLLEYNRAGKNEGIVRTKLGLYRLYYKK